MKSIKPVLAAIAGIAVVASTLAIAADSGGGGHPMMMHGGPGMMHGPMGMPGVHLSEAQRDKMFAIMHAQAPQMHELGKAVHQAHEAMRTLAQSDSFDEAKAAALSQQLGTAVAAMALQHAKVQAQTHALLTPEQRKQAAGAREQSPRHH
jgi:periplasmic protein CpxP/Spy